MNEFLFFIHIVIVLVFGLGALRLGKEAMIAWTCIQALLANLLVIKQMEFFGYVITCSDVFAVGGILGLNLLREYFGYETAKKTTQLCFYFMVFFAAMAKMHLLYVPSALDTAHSSYATILSPAPRLLFASLAVFFIVQQIDMRFFSYLKKTWTFVSLTYRNIGSLLLSQLIDTILFSIFGLYGLVDSLWDIIVVSFVVKVVLILSTTPLTLLSKKMIKPPKPLQT